MTLRRVVLIALPAVLFAASPPPPAAAPASGGALVEATWGYTDGENGPNQWVTLNRNAWSMCGTKSHLQAPLHIVDPEYDCPDDHGDPMCTYDQKTWVGEPKNVNHHSHRRLSMDSLKPITQAAVENNGHTLMVKVPPNHAAMYTTFEGRKYELLHYKFHQASEHKVNDFQFPLEMQMVHKKVGSDDLLIIGVFFEITTKANLFLHALGFVENGLPTAEGTRRPIPRHINPIGVLDPMSIYTNVATPAMRNNAINSASLKLQGRALSPETVLAFKQLKLGFDEYGLQGVPRMQALQDLYKSYSEERRPGAQKYHETHYVHHKMYKKKMYADGFEDLYFLDSSANVFYSVQKNEDFGRSFARGTAESSTGLGQAFQASMEDQEVVQVSEPGSYTVLKTPVDAVFLCTSVKESNKLIGIICGRLKPTAGGDSSSSGAAPAPAAGGHRRRAAAAAAPAHGGDGTESSKLLVGEDIVRTPTDKHCALFLNHLRINAGCHHSGGHGSSAGGHRRRAGGGGGDDGGNSKCPTCATPRTEATSDYSYWTYQGSLTTPPCSEGVTWVVLHAIAPVTQTQLNPFPFKRNFRPPQPIFSRKISSNSNAAWEWGYNYGIDGPPQWAQNGYTYCNGEHQSPINIDKSKVRTYTHFDFIPQYEPQHNLYIINTGRSIEVQLRLTKEHISQETGVKATFEFQDYFLTKIQFHVNSEHTVDGRHYAMEAEFHHRQEGDHHHAPHMVVSVLYEVGACDPQLVQLNWDAIPQTRDTIGMHVPDAFLVEDLMPMNKRYWTYDGTLTSPPCTPGVAWVILQEPRTVCQQQLDKFPLINSREFQPSDDRYVQTGSFRVSDGIADNFWHWDYYHQFRPTAWGRYYAGCTGSAQSPINIIADQVKSNGHGQGNKRLVLKWHSMCGLRTRNNGHTIMVDMPAGITEFEEVNWRVLSFHFHAPSENQLDGHVSPLEMQIMHSDLDLKGLALIISILFYEGTDNQFLDQLEWAQLPPLPHSKAEEEVHEVTRPVDLLMMINNKNSALEYYQYQGSLTTPPCTQNVKWVVMHHSDHLSRAQLLSFYNVLHHANFRTPQPLNGRVVQLNSGPHETSEKDLWGYSEFNGPGTWGAAGFPHCLERQQSPIELETATASKHTHYAIGWDEWRTRAPAHRLKVINDHNRMIEVKGFGKHDNKFMFEGQFYYLKEIMFHKSAETRIDGVAHALEAHFVHMNDVGMYLYLVVLFKQGAANPALAKLNWDRLQNLKMDEVCDAAGNCGPVGLYTNEYVNLPFSPDEIIQSIDLDRKTFPQGPTYYHYDGSMSTPPCDEGVIWVVLEQTASISLAQLAQYPFKGTVRPVQSMNGRTLHYMSSINVDALLAASKFNHESKNLAHSASHTMTKSSSHGGSHGAASAPAAAPAAAPAGGGHRRRAGAPPATSTKKGAFQFGYDVSNGPLKWAYHVPECIGYTQSPIDLNECALHRRTKNKMFPRWKFTPNVKILNNGHSLIVNGIKDSYTEFEGTSYQAEYFHFHSGSEHLLHSEQYPLELQVVHTLNGKPALVVAVIFDVGEENADLSLLYFGDEKNIPKRAGQETNIEFPFNPVHFMPYNKNYYSYDGSLTTPPCSEGVKWVVMQSTMSASSQQLSTFPFRTNFRNPQPLYGRPVYFMSQKDQYLYKTVTTGSSGIVHMSWALVLGTVASLLGLAY